MACITPLWLAPEVIREYVQQQSFRVNVHVFFDCKNIIKKCHQKKKLPSVMWRELIMKGLSSNSPMEEAERWFLEAARDGKPTGSIKAQTVLGLFYSRPGEDSFDLQKAYFCHQEATGNGSLESQGALGVMYEYGIGVRRDGEAAFKCLKEAAARGNVYAQGNLAVHYYRRKLLNKAADVAKSVGEQEDIEGLALETDCLPRYVAKGIALGCFVFARCLHHGLGVEKNREQAKRWYSRASAFDLDVVARLQDDMTYGYI